jgi:cytosine/adenosine deaminase-related metal-dependent hydrolase
VVGRADVLITDGRIAAVGEGLVAGPEAEVIDATGRIVMPGFVDTHRHTWQAGLRSSAADITLSDYRERVILGAAPRYRPEDVYAGELAGTLDALDAGVTTLLDWTHIQFTPDNTDETVRALRETGIRAVFGYCYGGDGGAAGMAAENRRVRDMVGEGGLITMAFAAHGPEFGSEERSLNEWRLARDLDLPVTTHLGGHGAESAAKSIAFLEGSGLISHRTTYIHPIFFTDDHLKQIADHGGTASFSPIVEAGLIGPAQVGRVRAAGIATSLSSDAATSGPGDMFSLMRATYVQERAAAHAFTVGDALRIATIEGAEVLGMAGEVGSLGVGKHGDVVLLRTDTLGMAPAHDPIASIVLSADRSVVDTVVVGGRVVKRDGRLVGHDVQAVLAALAESAAHVTKGLERV